MLRKILYTYNTIVIIIFITISSISQNILTNYIIFPTQGIKLQQVFSDVDFIHDGYECALRAVRRAFPSFTPQQRQTPVHYACNLVSSLNDDMFSNEVKSFFCMCGCICYVYNFRNFVSILYRNFVHNRNHNPSCNFLDA